MSEDTLHLQRLRPVTVCIEATFTRPNDTNIYANGDSICNSTSAPATMTFAGMVKGAGLSGLLQGAVLITSVAGSTSMEADLLLFDTSITPSNDNSAFTPSDGDAEKCVAVIQFRSAAGGSKLGANMVYDAGTLGRAFKCASGSTSLYGVLVARNAYTPGAQEVIRVRLYVIQD